MEVLIEKESKKSPFKFSFRKGVKPEEQITFAKNLAVMIDAGLPVSRAISILEKQTKNKTLKGILEKINNTINSGETLSKSLENFPNVFSGLFVSMVRAGEESGKLASSLRIIAGQLEKAHALYFEK